MEDIKRLEEEIAQVKRTLRSKEKELYEKQKDLLTHAKDTPINEIKQSKLQGHVCGILPKWAIERYSRQILLPDIGASGQARICAAKVLIVGVGGLGCPAAAYLAGTGVGKIGIVDYDTVDITNIHRQVLHGEDDQDMSKVESAANAMRRINSQIKVIPYNVQLDSKNALQIISDYDFVLDCTDNVPTRYLLSDACVLAKKTLISGSALKLEGQLTIYGYREDKTDQAGSGSGAMVGPCYRCVFPEPPPPHAVGSCSADGVAAPVPPVIGCLQALEAIKYIIGRDHTKLLVQRLLLFDGEDTSFRTVRLRPRNPHCAMCSETPTITKLLDYEAVCNSQVKEKGLDLKILPPQNRITPTQLAEKLKYIAPNKQRHLLVDVRSEAEFKMCRIHGASNYPIDTLKSERLETLLDEIKKCGSQVTFICRQGNDSQVAAQMVLEVLGQEHTDKIKDVAGGLHAWAKHVDQEFPIY